jgi:hypothetical protein
MEDELQISVVFWYKNVKKNGNLLAIWCGKEVQAPPHHLRIETKPHFK